MQNSPRPPRRPMRKRLRRPRRRARPKRRKPRSWPKRRTRPSPITRRTKASRWTRGRSERLLITAAGGGGGGEGAPQGAPFFATCPALLKQQPDGEAERGAHGDDRNDAGLEAEQRDKGSHAQDGRSPGEG